MWTFEETGDRNINSLARPPGTEFLDAETGRQKPPPKWGSAHRDKNPGNEWSEIPAETHYFSSCRKRAVCKDWLELVTHHPVIEPSLRQSRERKFLMQRQAGKNRRFTPQRPRPK